MNTTPIEDKLLKLLANKYVKYAVLCVLTLLLSIGHLDLSAFNPATISVGQIAVADEGNALPYDPGVTLPVSRTVEHGFAAIDFGTNGRTGINARSSRSGEVILNQNQTRGGYHPITGLACGFGNVVYIAYSNGDTGIYAHLARRSSLRVGQGVKQGDIVGEIGTTGCSDGIHLHYERQKRQVWSRNTAYIPTFKEYPTQTIVGGYSYTSQNTGQPTPPPAPPRPRTLAEQIQGRVSVHRGGDKRLYISWDNGTGAWQHPPAASTAPYGVSTDHAPTAVLDKYGQLNIFYVGGDAQVYQQILRGNAWTTRGTGVFTTHQPEVVLHGGYLNIFARGAQSQLLQASSGDNVNWGTVRTISTTHPVYSNPSAVVRGNELLVAYPTASNFIATISSVGGTHWGSSRTLPGLRTAYGLGLTTYQNRIIMVHIGGDKRGYFNASNDGVTWTSAVRIPHITINHGIDLEVVGDKLHLVHGGGDNQIYYQTTSRSDGQGWSFPTRQHPAHNSLRAITLTGK